MRRDPAALRRDAAANTAVEFALLAPVLCFLLIGGAFFALGLYQYAALTQGVRTGARQLASSLNDSTPYSDAVSALEGAAPALSTGQLSITITVNGTACTTDSACKSALSGAPVAAGATVTATYPCSVVVMGHNYLPSCLLTSTATEMIE
ncbi:MAG TPA: TadE/TadG family type IV pilus assembly protein [Stellaceae bacterium]|nr:TadE/TadG family type IV pilus assembly protein [Stellaceae bacterium]